MRVLADRELLVEAVATVYAAENVFVSLNGGGDTPLSEFFLAAGEGLRRAAFGEPESDDDAYMRDPTIVALWARSEEIAADALDASGIGERARLYRSSAEQSRSAGTIDVPFHTEVT